MGRAALDYVIAKADSKAIAYTGYAKQSDSAIFQVAIAKASVQLQACELVGARVAVQIHWGTFHAPLGKHLPRGWMDRGGPEFLEALAEQGSPTRGVLLAPGEAHPL